MRFYEVTWIPFCRRPERTIQRRKEKNWENKITWRWAETNPDNLKVIRNILTPECWSEVSAQHWDKRCDEALRKWVWTVAPVLKKTQLWRQYICDTIRSSELSRKKISFAVQGKNPNLGIFFTEEVEKQFHTAGERGGMNHKFFLNFRFSCSVLVWLDLSTKTTWLSLRKKTQFSHYPLASNLGTSTNRKMILGT